MKFEGKDLLAAWSPNISKKEYCNAYRRISGNTKASDAMILARANSGVALLESKGVSTKISKSGVKTINFKIVRESTLVDWNFDDDDDAVDNFIRVNSSSEIPKQPEPNLFSGVTANPGVLTYDDGVQEEIYDTNGVYQMDGQLV